jgi:hypothetical protein
MAERRDRVCAIGMIASAILLVAGCGDDSDTAATDPPATSSTTTTTVIGAGTAGPSETAPTWPDPEVPESFTVLLEESYVCQLGPAGESDIRAAGAVVVTVDDSQSGYRVVGEGDMAVTGFLRGGDTCTGDAAGTHIVRLEGTVPDDAAQTLKLKVTGTWYETWDGEIECSGGLPPSGPWQWPPEPNMEILTLTPFVDGATWEQDVTMGLCQGTVTRTIEF